jgi:hypothetical protein
VTSVLLRLCLKWGASGTQPSLIIRLGQRAWNPASADDATPVVSSILPRSRERNNAVNGATADSIVRIALLGLSDVVQLCGHHKVIAV